MCVGRLLFQQLLMTKIKLFHLKQKLIIILYLNFNLKYEMILLYFY